MFLWKPSVDKPNAGSSLSVLIFIYTSKLLTQHQHGEGTVASPAHLEGLEGSVGRILQPHQQMPINPHTPVFWNKHQEKRRKKMLELSFILIADC